MDGAEVIIYLGVTNVVLYGGLPVTYWDIDQNGETLQYYEKSEPVTYGGSIRLKCVRGRIESGSHNEVFWVKV